MKRNTLELLIIATSVYLVFLVLLRGLISDPTIPSVTILSLPVLVFVLIIVSDLSYRSTVPSKTRAPQRLRRFQARDLQYLSRQIEVASGGSQAYFESILLGRLRDVLIEKINLETGIEKEKLKKDLYDPIIGREVAGDPLYMLLYTPLKSKGASRVKALRSIVDGIEAWKP